MSAPDPLAALAHAYGRPALQGRIRDTADDFRVYEQLGFEPDGDGEHVLLLVRKRGANTVWVGERLAAFARLPARAVSYAGLKDRRAVCEQWFSLHLPRPSQQDPDWQRCRGEGFQVLRAVRHRRKLRRGSHAGNRFEITIRGLRGDRPDTPETLPSRLEQVRARGVPNYFGAQRFGRGGDNLARARALFAGEPDARRLTRNRRGLYLSAARSALFNRLLSLRVADGVWERALPGEAVLLAGSRSYFLAGPAADVGTPPDGRHAPAETGQGMLQARLAAFDCHPSGPLWGEGEPPCRHAALDLEKSLLGDPQWAALADGLAAAGLTQERRALRLCPEHLVLSGFTPDLGVATLAFTLPAGGYATAVLRELIRCADAPDADS